MGLRGVRYRLGTLPGAVMVWWYAIVHALDIPRNTQNEEANQRERKGGNYFLFGTKVGRQPVAENRAKRILSVQQRAQWRIFVIIDKLELELLVINR